MKTFPLQPILSMGLLLLAMLAYGQPPESEEPILESDIQPIVESDILESPEPSQKKEDSTTVENDSTVTGTSAGKKAETKAETKADSAAIIEESEIDLDSPLLEEYSNELDSSLDSAGLLENDFVAEEDEILMAMGDKNTLAVLHFQNQGGGEKYMPLERALADMVITDLSQVQRLTLIEREKINEIITELELTTSDSHRKPNQIKLASRVNSGSVITGKYTVENDKTIKIEAQLLDPSDNSEKIIGEAGGNLEEFFKLEKILVFGILDNLTIQLTERERLKIEVVPTENVLALLAYGRGLKASDKGDHETAAKEFSQAVKLDPKFKAAKEKKKKAQRLASGNTEQEEAPKIEIETPLELLGAGPEAFPHTLEKGISRPNMLGRMSDVMGRSFMPEAGKGDVSSGKTVRTGHSDEDGGGLDHGTEGL